MLDTYGKPNISPKLELVEDIRALTALRHDGQINLRYSCTIVQSSGSKGVEVRLVHDSSRGLDGSSLLS